MTYKLLFNKQAAKDWKKIKKSEYRNKFVKYFEILKSGDFDALESKPIIFHKNEAYSIRVNIRHRIVYRLEKDVCYVIIMKAWGHYDDNG